MKIKNKKIIVGIIVIIIIMGIFWEVMLEDKQKETILTDTENAKAIDIFEEYHKIAKEKVENMSLEEKIGQIFLIRLPDENNIEMSKQYKLGGYLFFEKDFRGKTEEEVKEKIAKLQENSKIPLLIAVDEEGGKVVRISSNQNLVPEKFKSPSELYSIGGFDKIKEDTIEKSKILNNLGVNLNLAPVVDISNNPADYMYQRTLGQDKELTSIYAKTVIEASKEGKVSYTLKHFPGYGGNLDTHKTTSVDNRLYEEIINDDILPFRTGIEAGAEAVLVSHNTVNSIASNNPASLSLEVNKLLRDKLGFRGVVITDDLDMGAVSNDEDRVVKAIMSGNDLLIVTDYIGSIEKVKKAIEERKN